jgi:hypothetical protein
MTSLKTKHATKLRIVAKPIHAKLILSINKLRDSRILIEDYIRAKGVDPLKKDPYIEMLLKDARAEVDKIMNKLS